MKGKKEKAAQKKWSEQTKEHGILIQTYELTVINFTINIQEIYNTIYITVFESIP